MEADPVQVFRCVLCACMPVLRILPSVLMTTEKWLVSILFLFLFYLSNELKEHKLILK